MSLTRGAELLRSWRAARRLTQTTLGQLLGGSHPWPAAQVCRWETGRHVPQLRWRRRIERRTRGFVKISDWLTAPEGIRAGGQLTLLEDA